MVVLRVILERELVVTRPPVIRQEGPDEAAEPVAGQHKVTVTVIRQDLQRGNFILKTTTRFSLWRLGFFWFWLLFYLDILDGEDGERVGWWLGQSGPVRQRIVG